MENVAEMLYLINEVTASTNELNQFELCTFICMVLDEYGRANKDVDPVKLSSYIAETVATVWPTLD